MSMRRGHPGSSGWRTENPRHFRPRGGGTPHFRPTRGYGLLDTPRFPPSGSRHNIGTPYHMHQGPSEDPSLLDRNNYRHTRSQRGLLHGQRQILPYLQQMRQSKDSQEHSPQFSSNYSESANQNDSHHMNLIGDNDLRQHQEPLRHSPWVNPPRNFYDEDRNYGKRPYRRQDDHTDANRSYGPEYTGHRPPASDHYQNPGSARDNSDSFSHSVDDTVDIIRKKMMNRNENPHHSGESIEHSDSDQRGAESAPNSFTLSQREQPAKRRIQREKQTAKANCEKMKSRIVHQLFKMDKDRIHKLMDNPSSSTKFEYAISSLITESQNSFNRHLRSVAEKSLCSSSNEFVNNDKNTIYEDTFMKQMQCILEPQDTVLLEDIKPMVLAELSKVLLLDEYEHNFERSHQAQSHQRNFKTYDYTESSQDHADNQLWQEHDNESVSNYHSEDITNDSKPLFVRRSSRKSEYTDIALPSDRQERSSDHIQERKSIDCTQETFSSDFKEKHDYSEERKASIESRRLSRISTDRLQGDENPTNSVIPLFDPNAEQVSEDDDPFEELDNQYHVPVDHNFLGIDDLANSESSTTNTELESSPRVKKEFSESLYTPKKTNVNTDIHTQLLDIAKAPLNIKSLDFTDIKKEVLLKSEIIKTEENDNTSVTPKSPARPISPLQKDGNNKQDNTQDKTATSEISEDSSNTVKSTSNSRKRSIDQRPSHRKEKRKKSDASRPDAGKQILNKNIIINVNDCTAKSSDKCDTASKSIFNLYFSKDENVKEDAKKSDIAEKVYSDKYVKRKEPASKTKEKDNEGKKRHNSSSSIHSIVSPKESSSSAINSISHITSPKSEVQKKLKPIDMFVEQHKKANVHQSRRNTAVPPVAGSKAVAENKPKPVKPSVMKIIKKHVGTQIIKKLHSKETQTIQNKTLSPIKKKMLNKAIQTELEQVKASDVRSNDAFERMKEIDLEIQVLLQEKFKLYNSLEAKDCNSMQTLGMTVLTPVGETKEIVEDPATTAHLSEDAIVDEFTNIPVEELEQIALESVQSELHESPTKPQHKGKESKKGGSKKRKNTSSISLIEQIISDDRPLEEIISLDELEIPKTRSKKKSHKKTKKKVQKRSKSALSCSSTPGYELKECYIKLIRKDYSRYLKPTSQEPILDTPLPDSNNKVIVEESNINVINDDKQDISVEETVVDDMQFDMLDVSEDIIIGDICEIKSAGDKDASEKMDIQISEEIILDNSQSSSDDVVPANVGPQGSVCKMYDYSADEDLKRDSVVVTGNSDAVLAIECIDNNFIAACLDGNVYYFSGDGQLINTMRGSNLAVTCLTIVKEKYGTTVYTGSLDSRIRYYDLETCLEKGPECNVLSPIQTMDRAWDTVFVGTRTGFVLQFECKNNMLIPVSTVKFSEQSILALRAMKEGPRKVLLVAARSENVTIKDAQTGLLLRTLEGPKMTVYTLLYEDGKVFCGTSSHQIHAFDYTSGGYVGTHEGGKGCVCLRATGGLLFSGCYDGCVYIYRDGESQPLAQLRGPSLMLLSLAIVGTKIIAGYKDRSLYIWKIPLTILQEMIL